MTTSDAREKWMNRQNKPESTFSNTWPQVLLVLLAFCEKNIVRYAILVFSMLPGIGFLSDLILPTLYVTLILFCMTRKTRVGLAELIVPAFVISAILVTCAIYPENAKFITKPSQFWNTIFPCLRWFIVGLVVIPDKAMMELLGKVSCLSVLAEVAFLFLYMIPNGLIVSDDMNRAYQLLPNILLVFNYAFNSKKIIPWLISVGGLIYLLSLGTRGPFLILLIFVVIKLLQAGTVSSGKRGLLVLGVAIFGGLLSNQKLYTSFLESISRWLNQMGVSARIIDSMIEGTLISNTTGRDDLYDLALQKISERPILGYGVYGEWPWIQWNIHNMYLEILIHFGVVLGSALLIWAILLVARSYFQNQNRDAKDLILIFICFVFVRGFFGGSYLTFSTFFLIALCTKELRRIRQQRQKI